MTAVNLMLVIMVLSLLAYALLAGADFGGGAWDLLAGAGRDRRSAEDQRSLISGSLGPVWEANHVWLIFVIVCTFSGFPSAFGDIATSLELPLALALVGIVLRGASYVYRAYGEGASLPDRWWSRIFACASVLTPFMLGVSGAALATGRLRPGSSPTVPFQAQCSSSPVQRSITLKSSYMAVPSLVQGGGCGKLEHLMFSFRVTRRLM